MGEKSLAELTAGLVEAIEERRAAAERSADQERDASARRRTDEAAVREGINVTSSFSHPDPDEGGGLASVGQGSRTTSHSPELGRRIPLKRPRRLRP